MRSINAGVQRQIQQEISTVFRCRSKYAEEVKDPASEGHPNFVAYLDWFAGPNGLDREVYLVMEFCPFSLADMIFVAGNLRGEYEKSFALKRPKSFGGDSAGAESPGEKKSPICFRFSECEVVKVLCDLLNALTFMNRHGMAHRDVKTENILWAEGRYKLADFGTAMLFESSSSRRDESGTLWIMAPELLGRRPHGLNCDVWSLGVVLFEVASFAKPFNSKELLAYRNSSEAAFASSFWPFLCSTSGVSTPVRSGAKTLPRLKSSSELPRTPSRGARTVRSKCRSVTLPPLSQSGKEVSEGDADSPTSQTAGSEDPLLQQRFSFLRKRLLHRWCYGEELRSLIFEDMLREEPELRPSASEVFESPRGAAVLACHPDGEVVEPAADVTPEELLRSVTAVNFLRAMNLPPTPGGYLSRAQTS